MIYLVLVSILWGFSFGLIKAEVSALHPILVSLIRLSLAALVFVPFLRRRSRSDAAKLMAIGFLQFGLMYCLYISAYRYLQGHEIAILTVTTPIFVVLIDSLWTRKLNPRNYLAAGLALAGAAALLWQKTEGKELSMALLGVALIQVANLCFAGGQLLYKNFQAGENKRPDHRNFVWLYLGAIMAPACFLLAELTLVGTDNIVWPQQASQWWALAYLGLIPSGLGFYLWNKGVTKVSAGWIAVMNNFKIPAAVLVAWLIFSESIQWAPVLISLACLALALWMTRKGSLVA
jgi:drug/metabolite transporter (DMT)-like permease